MTLEEIHAVLHAVGQAKETIEHEFSPDGYNIGIIDGSAAGQTIPHLPHDLEFQL